MCVLSKIEIIVKFKSIDILLDCDIVKAELGNLSRYGIEFFVSFH